MRVLHEVYLADGMLAPEERGELDQLGERLGAPVAEIEKLDLGASLARLEQSPRQRKLMYAWIAHALFVDNAFSADERSFVDRVIAKYRLSGDELRAEIKAVQSRKVDEAIEQIAATLD